MQQVCYAEKRRVVDTTPLVYPRELRRTRNI